MMLGWIVVSGVAWLAAAAGEAVLIGRTAQLRNRQVPWEETKTQQLTPAVRSRFSPENESFGVDVDGHRRHRRAASRPVTSPGTTRPERRGWVSPRRRRLLAASLALVAVLGIGGLSVRTAELQAERDAQTVQAQSIFDVVARFDQPGSRHAFLSATQGARPVAAVLVHDGVSKVLTVGLPPNATDRSIYVLWGIGNGAEPQAIGAFDVVNTRGGADTIGPVPAASGFTAYAISIEPGRTVPTAPSQVVASGAVET